MPVSGGVVPNAKELDVPMVGEVILVAVRVVDMHIPDVDPINVKELDALMDKDVPVVVVEREVVPTNPVDTKALVPGGVPVVTVEAEVPVDGVDPINAMEEGAPVGGEVLVVVMEVEALAATVDNMSDVNVPAAGGLQDGTNTN